MRKVLAGVTGLVLLTAAVRVAAGTDAVSSSNEVNPIKVGEVAQDVELTTVEGKNVKLKELFGEKGAVLIFYRGGWCPFCNKHLQAVEKIQDKLRAAGYPVLAISPEKVDHLKETAKSDKLSYTLLSDQGGAAVRAFGLAYKVDEKTRTQYAKYKLDLSGWSGQAEPELPVPALYVVDKTGRVMFLHFDPDYSKRISNDEILKAAGATADTK